MNVLRDSREGVLLSVRAQSGARANTIRGVHQGALKVAVTQKAEKGKANKAIQDLLCKTLHLRRSQLTLIAGETCPDKQFLVRDVARQVLAQRIDAALHE